MKTLIVGLVCILWYFGGQKKGRTRDVGVPILISIGLIFLLKGDFLLRFIAGILTCATLNIIRLGYGNWDPEHDTKPCLLARLTHDRQGAIIRAIWGCLVGIVAPICLVVMRYLSLPKYALFIGLNTLIGFLVSKLRLPVLLTDICVAGGIGGLLFLL